MVQQSLLCRMWHCRMLPIVCVLILEKIVQPHRLPQHLLLHNQLLLQVLRQLRHPVLRQLLLRQLLRHPLLRQVLYPPVLLLRKRMIRLLLLLLLESLLWTLTQSVRRVVVLQRQRQEISILIHLRKHHPPPMQLTRISQPNMFGRRIHQQQNQRIIRQHLHHRRQQTMASLLLTWIRSLLKQSQRLLIQEEIHWCHPHLLTLKQAPLTDRHQNQHQHQHRTRHRSHH
mmetsp:Transcript_53594/g.61880  ORF Transcript_53594/g.61880 Transcript_53594/m.61880 type:complete len:228 (-) Transcript_53594:555-1238(-)